MLYSPGGGLSLQEEKGSPSYPWGQLQMGLWPTTSHLALMPHTPTQGLAHLRLIQARLGGHSLLMTHSGRQLGAAPMYPGHRENVTVYSECKVLSLLPGRHVHTGLVPDTWHSALGPQGEGVQGSTGSGGGMPRGSREHCTKGSPRYPSSHLHTGW